MNARQQAQHSIATLAIEGQEIPLRATGRGLKSWDAYVWEDEAIKALHLRENGGLMSWAIKYLQANPVIRKGPPKRASKVRAQDAAFYREAWDYHAKNGHCKCEECGCTLPEFSPVYISHNLSRGAWPRLRAVMDNISILCYTHHREWETGDRKRMKIYPAKAPMMGRLMQGQIKR